MVYDSISYIESNILEPFRMCGRFADNYEVTIGGNDENDCMCGLTVMTEQHGELVWWSGYRDEDYENGEYIGQGNFVYD